MRAFPDSVTMRRAVPDDAEALTSLHLDVWEDAYVGLMPDRVFSERRATISERIDRWRVNLASSPAATTVVEDGTGLIGFASIGPGRDEDSPHDWVCVDHGVAVVNVLRSEVK